MKNLTAFVAVAAITAMAALAHAESIGYTVSGLGPTQYPGPYTPPAGAPHLVDGLGYPGDAVGLTTYTGTLDLTPGTYIQKINTLNWSISYTYAGTDNDWTNDDSGDWVQLQSLVNATRTISFNNGPAGFLVQTGLLEVNWDNDYLAVSAGLTSIFDVPGYQIAVTPLAVARTAGSNFAGFPGGTPWIQPAQDIMARFDITAVPEPGTLALLGMAALGLLACASRRLQD
jgi:hypothetical protein